MIDKYPTLKLLVRFGSIGAPFAALLAAALVAGAAWSALGWTGLLLAAFVGGLMLVVGLAFVELVKLITDLLLPQ